MEEARVLRRTRSERKFENRHKERLKKVDALSDNISRRRNPGREAKHLLSDLKALPSPIESRDVKLYLHALDNIQTQLDGHEQQIKELTEAHDIRESIQEAESRKTISPLVRRPERLWAEEDLRLLLFRSDGVTLRSSSLAARMMVYWMKGQPVEEYFRTDGGSKTLLRLAFATVDKWRPVLGLEFYAQCRQHCTELPKSLYLLLYELGSRLPKLTSPIMLSALFLVHFNPIGLRIGFSAEHVKEAMQRCRTEGEDEFDILEIARTLSS